MQKKCRFFIQFLDSHLNEIFKDASAFKEVFSTQGEIIRQHKNRCTLRVQMNEKNYYLKLHRGVGWWEIFKNLLCGRLPVLGAEQEWLAIQRLEQLEVSTMRLAGYGSRGCNPAHLQSFVMTEELTDTISLEDYCQDWLHTPPPLAVKRALIEKVAHIARTLHSHGINHRDFYLCHFLLKKNTTIEQLIAKQFDLFLIDLHRVQLRRKTPARWMIKDLSGLYFSSAHLGLDKKDIFHFLKIYYQNSLRHIFHKHKRHLMKIAKRTKKQLTKHQKLFSHKSKVTEKKPVSHFKPKKSHQGLSRTLWLAGIKKALIRKKVWREIPGKRAVWLADYDETQVVAKIFYRYRYAERELRGLELLQKANLPTVSLLQHDFIKNEKRYVLVMEEITDAVDLSTLWPRLTREQQLLFLEKLVMIFAKMHEAGLLHDDPHLKNFLVKDESLVLIDTAAISMVKNKQGVTLTAGLKNLAFLFAQLLPEYDVLAEQGCLLYIKQRHLIFTLKILSDFKKWIEKKRQQRLIAYSRKIFRTTSALQKIKSWRSLIIFDRHFNDENMTEIIRSPDKKLPNAKHFILKAGNTCTLIQVITANHNLVIKRYNIKNFWHGIKKCWRPSRAVASWRNAHCFNLMNIASVKPVALVEKRFGPLRFTTYFIYEYRAGTKLSDGLLKRPITKTQKEIAKKTLHLLDNLKNIRMSHGDLKATNILIDENNNPFLIDLDAAEMHCNNFFLQKALKRDKKRFMKNWEGDPEVMELFEKASSLEG